MLRMNSDPVVALLAEQSLRRLLQMDTEIQEQTKTLQVRRELIRDAINEKHRQQGTDAAKATRVVPPRTPRQNTPREAFREVLRTRPDHEWRPTEVLDGLEKLGSETNAAAVRTMLRRMGTENEVIRTDRGWKLASRNGSHAEPSSGPTENETSEPLFPAARSQEAANE